jgi:outer membrane lipoprotein LolB
MPRFIPRASLVALCVALHGCALHRPETPSAPLAQPRLYELKNWRLEGRIGVRVGEEGWSADLFWTHEGRQDRLRVSGPFSQGMVSIVVQDDLIYVNEGEGRVSSSRNPDALLQERLGFAVPLRSLRYWMLGVPAPDAEYRATRDGDAPGFIQQGWTLAFQGYARRDGLNLPSKFTASGENVKLKLIVDEWRID